MVDLTQNTAYALHAKQSLPQTKALECPHLQHLRETQEHWPAGATFLAVDGAYARHNFVHGACDLGLHVVSRLRRDANVRTLYTGPQKPRGANNLYGEKLRWKQLDLTLWNDEGELEPGVRLYSRVVNHVSLKRNIKIALLIRDTGKATGKAPHILLFCTDLQSSGRDIVRRSTSPNLTRGTPKARHSPGPQRTRNAPTSISCNSFVPNSNSIGVTCNPIHS